MRHANKVLGAIAAIVAVAVLYFAAYLAMVIPCPDAIDPDDFHLTNDLYSLQFRAMATYRFGGDKAKRFFGPANELDRKLRPKSWEFDPFVGIPAGSSS